MWRTGLIIVSLCYVLGQFTGGVDREFEGINTGEGIHALRFTKGGVQLQTHNIQANTLSSNLKKGFSFELWAMIPGAAADLKYKTICGRWQRGPDGFHNRWADWDFQVQASGDINFFMGNQGPSIYGFLLWPRRTMNKGQWYHLGFTVEQLENQTNPTYARVIVNNEVFPSARGQPWLGGTRNYYPNQPIWVGNYFNQDGDFKWWNGYMDEIRFWNEPRTLAQFVQWQHKVVPYDTPKLLAYYRLNDGGGGIVRAEGRPEFDGRIDDTGIVISAQWRTSGAKIDVDVKISSGEYYQIRLPGMEPPPGGALTFIYWISSLPTMGKLLSDGQYITAVPFRLADNTVTYQAPQTTLEPEWMDDFTYFGTDSLGVRESYRDTIVYVSTDGFECIPDKCGRCNGDNSTCTCTTLPYNGLNLADIERVLLLFEIEQVMDLLQKLEGKFENLLYLLKGYIGVDLGLWVQEVMDFNKECLMEFCTSLDPYLERLAAIGPSN